MINKEELELRKAHAEWLKAKGLWALALTNINVAKQDWEKAQTKFYGNSSPRGGHHE